MNENDVEALATYLGLKTSPLFYDSKKGLYSLAAVEVIKCYMRAHPDEFKDIVREHKKSNPN